MQLRDAVDELVFVRVIDADEIGVHRLAVRASRRPVDRDTGTRHVVTVRRVTDPLRRARISYHQPSCVTDIIQHNNF